MKNRTFLVVLSIAASAAAGCTGFERESSLTSPTAAGNNSMLGTWTSAQLDHPDAEHLHRLRVDRVRTDGDDRRGAFSATCPATSS